MHVRQGHDNQCYRICKGRFNVWSFGMRLGLKTCHIASEILSLTLNSDFVVLSKINAA